MPPVPALTSAAFWHSLEAFTKDLQAAEKSHNTIRGYREAMCNFAAWFEQATGRPLAPSSLTRDVVRAYQIDLLDEGALRHTTINRRLAGLTAYARWALATGQILADPMARIPRLPTLNTSPGWLNPEQRIALQRILKREKQWVARNEDGQRALWRQRNATLLIVLWATGLRVSEAAGLNVGHVNLQSRPGVVRVVGEGAKARLLLLTAEAQQMVERWLLVRPAISDEPALFVSQRLTRMTLRSMERVVAEYGQQAGLEALTPQQLRHTFARQLIEQGAPLDHVAARLGHASLHRARLYALCGLAMGKLIWISDPNFCCV